MTRYRALLSGAALSALGIALAAPLILDGALPAQAQVLPAATVTATPSDPAGNATTSDKMAGLGVTGAGGGWRITPVRTGRVLFTVTGSVANSTATNGWAISIAIGPNAAVAAPANGASLPSGSIQCTKLDGIVGLSTAANDKHMFSASCVATGLTTNQLYWADLQYKAVTGGTVTLTNLTVAAAEF
jgi:hypothetical protein